jgi:altronate dehydratase
MTLALVISARDNVATALEPLEPGRTIPIGDASITVRDDVPRGHKVALQTIARGQAVVKYGSSIGTASTDIPAGAHVHTHNLASTRGRGDLARPADPSRLPAAPDAGDPSAARIAEPPDGDRGNTSATGRLSR